MDVGELLQTLRNTDLDDLKRIGTAPKPLKVVIIVVVCLAVIGLGAWLFVLPQLDKLEVAERKEPTLRQQFDAVQNKAANLGAYKSQLEEMRRSFGAMLRQLPNKTDVESLLVDLSQTSVASGLEVDFFKPGQEIPKEFYAEYPIELSVSGKYHEFGMFVSGLAALPRIVTLQDIKIEPQQNDAPSGELSMKLTAVTYRYLDEDEISSQSQKAKQ